VPAANNTCTAKIAQLHNPGDHPGLWGHIISTRRLRIAFCTQAAPWEGTPRSGLYNLRLAQALCAAGHDCEIFVLSLGGLRWLEPALPKLRGFNARPSHYEYRGVNFHTVRAFMPHPLTIRWRIAPRFPALAGGIIRSAFARGLEPALRDFNPDVLLCHDGVSLGRLMLRMHQRLGLPWGVVEQDALELDPGTALGRDYAKTLSSAHAVWYLAEKYAAHARNRLALPRTAVMLNGTQFPTDEQRAAPRPEKWRGKRIILCVGTFVPRKGHDVLARAFAAANLENTVLAIVGNPPPPALRSLINELGIADRVEFIDYMQQEELQQYMVWADLFALTSWDEPFGMVYVEAMSAQTPVLMCDDCGLASQITEGTHGWAVPPRDVQATATALGEAFAPSTDLAAMGRAGRTLVEERFTWETSARQILARLENIPAQGAGAAC
jgi:glycosyltransferase involved in cell wall biosynthesis